MGFGYIALSGREWNFFIFLPKALPLGWVILPFQGVNGFLFALKGQHTLAQRIALGTNKHHPPHFPP